MARDTTLTVEAGAQAAERGIVGGGIDGAIHGRHLAKHRQRCEPEGRLIARELRELAAGTIAGGILGLDGVEDSLWQRNGSLRRDALIADGPRAGIEGARRPERIGTH